MYIKLFLCLMVMILAGCGGSSRVYAPVTDISTIEQIPQHGTYRVKKGETLYSIAWRYGQDYRYLARLNHIGPPWRVKTGQLLRLSGPAVPVGRPVFAGHPGGRPLSSPNHPVFHPETDQQVAGWIWPARGALAGVYSSFNRGINIAGRYGQPVFATAAGQVVYAGHGLRGYGNLVIIKHNSHWLSAYAWNSKLRVREGQKIRAGQEIATMGSFAQKTSPMLHFEIRKDGQPVNPLRYLSR